MDYEKLKRKYKGTTASNYEEKRKHESKWFREQRVVELLLRKIVNENGNRILDVPVGTGRFFGIYNDLDVNVLGVDISEDMLEKAKEKKSHKSNIDLKKGDVFELDIGDFKPDIIICNRLFHWLGFERVKEVLHTFSKLKPKYLIIGIQIYRKDFVGFNIFLDKMYHKFLGKYYNEAPFRKLINFIAANIVTYIKSGGRTITIRNETTTVHNEEALMNVLKELKLKINCKKLIYEENAGSKWSIYLLKGKT